jgi:hypothetical protein
MSTVNLSLINYSFIYVECDMGTAQEISDHFTFYVPNYRFMPSYQNGLWDGQIRLFNVYNGELPSGLLIRLMKFCENNDIKITFNKNMRVLLPKTPEKGVKELLAGYNLPFEAYDHQVDSIERILKNKRILLLSATSSGKSLVIYSTIRDIAERGLKTLVIVPTTSLVEQLYKDCADYGWDIENHANKIYGGKGKNEIIVKINDYLTYLGEDWVYLNTGKKIKAKNLKEGMELK